MVIPKILKSFKAKNLSYAELNNAKINDKSPLPLNCLAGLYKANRESDRPNPVHIDEPNFIYDQLPILFYIYNAHWE